MATTPEIVFAGTNGGALTEIADYEAVGGFQALAKSRTMTPDEIIEELNASNLRGRGGAFFPTGRKWSFVPKPDKIDKPHYLVINADESEPGTFKDREIMLRVPFRFLEGSLIAARAIESTHVFIYIRGEYEAEFEVLVSALEQMRAKQLLGDVTIVLHRGAGAYICGEETALLESLEGRRGQPRTKPPFPAIAGLYASPTAVNNVESITSATSVLEIGGAEYAKLGIESSTGHARLLALGQRRQRRQLRAAPRLPAARPDQRPRRRRRRRPQPQGGDPGRLVDRDPDRRRGEPRHARLRLARRRRHGDRLRGGDRDRRPLLHGAARGARLPVLRARVVRQVHPVPRRHQVADDDPPEDRGRPRHAGRHGPARVGCRAHQRQVPLPARRLGRDRGDELLRQVPRRVPGAHRRGRLPVPRRLVARPAPRARRDARPRRRSRCRCRHDATSSRSRSTTARSRSRRAPGSSRRRRRPGSRFPSSVTSPGSGRPSARAGCASSRSRGCRSSRPAAGSPRRTAWSSRQRRRRRRRPRARTRRSSSSSSTTRSTAPSATRAASARCRTSRSATGRATPGCRSRRSRSRSRSRSRR